MNLPKLVTATAAFAAGLTLMGAAASAATATASVNVRSGPGTGYAVVDTLFRGEQVNVGQCRSGFCYITHSGPDGWVSSRYLTEVGPIDSPSRPSISLDFNFGRPGFPFPPRPGGGGGNSQELVCLVTFFRADQVEAGADANVQRARVMTRAEAERRDRPGDRQGIFDYGSNAQTRETCDYLDRLN